MAKKKPRVVVTRKLPDATETRMMELFDVRLNISDEPISRGSTGVIGETRLCLSSTLSISSDRASISFSLAFSLWLMPTTSGIPAAAASKCLSTRSKASRLNSLPNFTSTSNPHRPCLTMSQSMEKRS